MPIPDPGDESPLTPYRISGLPASFFYIPEFLSPAEEATLLQKVGNSSKSLVGHNRTDRIME